MRWWLYHIFSAWIDGFMASQPAGRFVVQLSGAHAKAPAPRWAEAPGGCRQGGSENTGKAPVGSIEVDDFTMICEHLWWFTMILWWFLLGPTKVLRFEGVLADDVEENENRKFVIAVSLGDDSVGAAWPGNHGSIFCSEMWPPKPWEFLTHVLHRSHFTAFCGRITRVPSQT